MAIVATTAIFITNKQRLFFFGQNAHMVIGSTVPNPESPLVDVFPFKNKKIVQFCTGDYHSLLLTDDGLVYGCGYNGNGEHGGGNYLTCPYRHLDCFYGIPVKFIGAGDYMSLFQTVDNRVWCCGTNDKTSLGVGKEYIGQHSVRQLVELVQFSPISPSMKVKKIYMVSIV
jgi:alpha-tubulin suppressor-like RCC1 family protein